ncbi:MAG: hypothetical protein ACI9CF_001336 [Candidatus Omnitrophota bacterium]|jgi:hypothetical protein
MIKKTLPKSAQAKQIKLYKEIGQTFFEWTGAGQLKVASCKPALKKELKRVLELMQYLEQKIA